MPMYLSIYLLHFIFAYLSEYLLHLNVFYILFVRSIHHVSEVYDAHNALDAFLVFFVNLFFLLIERLFIRT